MALQGRRVAVSIILSHVEGSPARPLLDIELPAFEQALRAGILPVGQNDGWM